ncbi:MAG: hypothetical protein GVY27_06360 [Deinococcus-Thermus bacterium]|nr:hypothetical protein [Deinococcota bacterium]
MTAERRLATALEDPQVDHVHLSGGLRRALGISRKAAERQPRLRPHRDLPGALMIVVRRRARDNVELLAYDEAAEAFARSFAERPAWHRLGL